MCKKDEGRALVCERDVLLMQFFLPFLHFFTTCCIRIRACFGLLDQEHLASNQLFSAVSSLHIIAMSRVAGIVCAVSLVLYGASWPFILPASTPRGAPQQGAGAIAGQPSASSAAPESAGSWSPIAIGAALGLLAAVATTRPALAADLENGEAVFQGNCTACHAGGNNSIVAEKKLKKDALVTYGKYDVGAIITQVTNGNGSMPAFGDKLGPDDIEEHM